MTISDLLDLDPFSLPVREREGILLGGLKDLTAYHHDHCAEYRKILRSHGVEPHAVDAIGDVPFLPVRLFKEYELKSISDEDVFKVMTSSGTTGQRVSRIVLDKETAVLQTKVLTKIVTSFLGANRLPMIVIDTEATLKNVQRFSARTAGIIGFSIFGRDKFFALDEDMKLDLEGLQAFLAKHAGKKILLFGFTFIVWQHFYQELLAKAGQVDLSNGILFHGGGWKKLQSEAVSEMEFRERLNAVCGLGDIHNYYGMVEQTGSIFVECEHGYFHSSIFGDVIVRDQNDLSIAPNGERGVIQVLSLIPRSYPGHSLLTEDEGMIAGDDGCACGRPGKYFKVYGRLAEAEIRGCSDTYAERAR